MKRVLGLFLFSLVIMLASCGGSSKNGGSAAPQAQAQHSFVGTFTDEFGNRFTLNEDYTATIAFQGIDSLIQTTWFDGVDHTQPFISIAYNGDPGHWYLRDGQLYRGEQDMINGRTPIKITYEN